jgi:aryl-alcohol dehydrogenase-like predicted oxidoreductase
MRHNNLGPFGAVSRLTLGGGGIGMVWGEASEDDAIDTLHRAVEAGIDLIDTAPGYKSCEAMIARAFEGRLPAGVRITTKYGLGNPPAAEVYPRLRASLLASLAAMRLSQADMMVLHTEIRPDDFVYPNEDRPRDERSTSLSLYRESVVPAFERLVAEGADRRLGSHRLQPYRRHHRRHIRGTAPGGAAGHCQSPGQRRGNERHGYPRPPARHHRGGQGQ